METVHQYPSVRGAGRNWDGPTYWDSSRMGGTATVEEEGEQAEEEKEGEQAEKEDAGPDDANGSDP